MSIYTMGDLAQYRMLSGRGATLRNQMNELTVEATTGLVANKTERLRGNYGPINGIETRIRQIDAFRTVSTEQQVVATVIQTALGTVTERASSLAANILAAGSGTDALRVDTIAEDAASKLEAVLSSLNARVGEQSIFSGKASYTETFGTADELLTALKAAIDASGALTATDVETAIDDWFADPAGFEATMYHGGDPLEPVQIGTDELAQIDVTGMDSALVETIKGIAQTAVLTRGVLAGADVARADLAKRSGESLAGSQQRMAVLGARLGTAQAEMANAMTRNDAEKNALEQSRLDLLSVDGYETAAKFQEAQGQLSTLYTLTSRASRLSLVDYL